MAFLETVAVLLGIPTRAKISSITLDASVRETHTSTAFVTNHPVESGVDISDHVRRQPDSLVIEGIISNTSIEFPANVPGVAAVKGIATIIGGVENDPVHTAYRELKNLVEGKKLVSIVTSLRKYDNMLLEEFSVNRDATNGNALNFTVRAREIRIANIQRTTELPPKPVDPEKSIEQQNAGTKPLRETTAATAPTADNSTLLSNITGGGKSFPSLKGR